MEHSAGWLVLLGMWLLSMWVRAATILSRVLPHYYPAALHPPGPEYGRDHLHDEGGVRIAMLNHKPSLGSKLIDEVIEIIQWLE